MPPGTAFPGGAGEEEEVTGDVCHAHGCWGWGGRHRAAVCGTVLPAAVSSSIVTNAMTLIMATSASVS